MVLTLKSATPIVAVLIVLGPILIVTLTLIPIVVVLLGPILLLTLCVVPGCASVVLLLTLWLWVVPGCAVVVVTLPVPSTPVFPLTLPPVAAVVARVVRHGLSNFDTHTRTSLASAMQRGTRDPVESNQESDTDAQISGRPSAVLIWRKTLWVELTTQPLAFHFLS